MTARGAWAFPPQVNRLGGVATLPLEQSLQQSLQIILGTARGERVMRPTYGLSIQEYGFEVINVATLDLMRTAIREGLMANEPRLVEVEVAISTEDLGEGSLLVVVHYRAERAADVQTLTHNVPVAS